MWQSERDPTRLHTEYTCKHIRICMYMCIFIYIYIYSNIEIYISYIRRDVYA